MYSGTLNGERDTRPPCLETLAEAQPLIRTDDIAEKRGKIGTDRLDLHALSIPQGVPDDRIGCRLPIHTQVKSEAIAIIGAKLKYIRRLTIRATWKQFPDLKDSAKPSPLPQCCS